MLFLLAIPAVLIQGVTPGLESAPAPAATVTALSARTRLAWEGGIETLHPSDSPFELASSAYLELDAGAEAMVSWPGSASLRLTGPARLEWDPARDGEPFVYRLFQARAAYLDVRRHGVRVHLVGWRLSLRVGSVYLECKPDGSWRVHHDAGRDALLSSRDVPGEEVRVPAGSRLSVARRGGLRRLSGPPLSFVRVPSRESRVHHPGSRSLAGGPGAGGVDAGGGHHGMVASAHRGVVATVRGDPRLELPEINPDGPGMRRTVWSAREFLDLVDESRPGAPRTEELEPEEQRPGPATPSHAPEGPAGEDAVVPPAPLEVPLEEELPDEDPVLDEGRRNGEPPATAGFRLGVLPRFDPTAPLLVLPCPAVGLDGSAAWSLPPVWRHFGAGGLELFRYGIRRKRPSR